MRVREGPGMIREVLDDEHAACDGGEGRCARERTHGPPPPLMPGTGGIGGEVDVLAGAAGEGGAEPTREVRALVHGGIVRVIARVQEQQDDGRIAGAEEGLRQELTANACTDIRLPVEDVDERGIAREHIRRASRYLRPGRDHGRIVA